jgi:hypothetical protein
MITLRGKMKKRTAYLFVQMTVGNNMAALKNYNEP